MRNISDYNKMKNGQTKDDAAEGEAATLSTILESARTHSQRQQRQHMSVMGEVRTYTLAHKLAVK